MMGPRMQPDQNMPGLEDAGPHDVSAVAAATGASCDWQPFVAFSICNFISLLTSVFSLMMLLSLHLMQYSTVLNFNNPYEQLSRDRATYSLVTTALVTLIFSILCLLLAAHFAVMIAFCRFNAALAWRKVLPIVSFCTLGLFLVVLLINFLRNEMGGCFVRFKDISYFIDDPDEHEK